MKARLARYRGNELTEQHLLMDGIVRVGRALGNHIQLLDQGISKQHAVFRGSGGRWEVEDAGSRNGVFVNGKQIRRATGLRNGDEVRFGLIDYTFEIGSGIDWQAVLSIDASRNAATQTMISPPLPRR